MTLARLFGVLSLVLAVAPAALAAPLLVQEPDVTVDSAVSDRFTWSDASGQLRSASLAHNNVLDPTGNYGGKLWQYTYVIPGPLTRTVRSAQTSGASGFGYVVSHANDLANCLGDDSPLGHAFAGTFTRVFQGRHHAIFRFQQNYPRNCTAPPAAPAQFTVPVTIDWVFSTGRDHPLWAVTWDLFGISAGLVNDDTRAPYGEMLFDGSLTEGGHSQIAGVAWGERYKFQSTTNPVTYNSAWDYSPTNSVPYVKLWTTAVDATMGTVQTQTIQQHDAGGYFGFGNWGSSSALLGGPACGAGQEFPGPPAPSLAHTMPCSFNWPYQSINYSMGEPGGGNNNVGTNNTRLAWGASFGALGQMTYNVLGSANQAGPVGNGIDPNYGADSPTAIGHPKNSYSVFVVLGRHMLGPVEAQVTQIERVQSTALTASVGTVRTSGPAGVNRSDTVTYAPAGWNHVRAAWALQAGGNQVDANFSVGVGMLTHPLIIVSDWTVDLPSAVRLNGMPLVQDVDYFPSLRTPMQELWITLNQNLAGAMNHLEILPGAPLPGPPPGPPPGPLFSGGIFVATGHVTSAAGPAQIVTGPGPGRVAEVRVFDADGAMRVNYQVYPSGFLGGIRVAACNFGGDSRDEIVSVVGPGGAPQVRIMQFDTAGHFVGDLASFFAYDLGFTGGLFVACADLDGDGIPEIILGVDAGGGPHVRILKFVGGVISVMDEFFAYDPGFRGGIRVAAGNVDGSNRASLILGAGPGGGPHVRVLKYLLTPGSWQELVSVMVYDPGFRQGIFVAAGDVTGSGAAQVITGADAGGGPHVRALRYDAAVAGGLAPVGEFFAYDAGFRGGVRVAVGSGHIVTGAGFGGGPQVNSFTSAGGVAAPGFFAYESGP